MTWFNFLALVISTRDSWIDVDDDLYPMIAKTRSFYHCLLEKGCKCLFGHFNYLAISIRGHLQTKIFTLNVIVTLKGGGLWQMSMTLIFEISIARAQKDINSMQVQ